MITISLATMKEREESLKQVVKTLLPQTDKLNIYLHGYDVVPSFLKNKKINVVLEKDEGDRKDNDKFFFMKDIKSGYHIICDDDLIYPQDFIKRLIRNCKKYGNKVVVGYHGRVFDRLPIATYYGDSIGYPCLDTVKEDTAVDIIGTGCLCYHSNLKIKIDYTLLESFMSDIHFSLYCKKNNIPMIVLKHEKGYITHFPIDYEKTIWAEQVNNDYTQTSYINNNPEYYQHYKPEILSNLPIVSVIIATTRLKEYPTIVKECYDSIKTQTYPNIEIIVVSNDNGFYTIGKCWNDGIKIAKGELIFFIGDDDIVSNDYINSLVSAYLILPEKERQETVQITSYLTMFRNNGKLIKERRDLIPTGIWQKQYLLENPIVENKVKYVDTQMMEEMREKGLKPLIVEYHYGYMYRSHEKQISGMKLMGVDKVG